MTGARRFAGETRLPRIVCIGDRCRSRRYYVSSAALTAARAGEAIGAHWQIGNGLGARPRRVILQVKRNPRPSSWKQRVHRALPVADDVSHIEGFQAFITSFHEIVAQGRVGDQAQHGSR